MATSATATPVQVPFRNPIEQMVQQHVAQQHADALAAALAQQNAIRASTAPLAPSAALSVVGAPLPTVATPASAAAAAATPAPVISVTASTDEQTTRSQVRRLQFEWVIEPAPENWKLVAAPADQEAVMEVFRRLVSVHNAANDPPYECKICPIYGRRDDAAPGAPSNELRVLYYNCCAFGYRNPITLEDMQALRACHPRVYSVCFDPNARGQDSRNIGALVVGVNTHDYQRDFPPPSSAIPPPPVVPLQGTVPLETTTSSRPAKRAREEQRRSGRGLLGFLWGGRSNNGDDVAAAATTEDSK